MKGFGTFALVVGACWLIFALSMDVSVPTGAGGRVNNLGLMADRQIHTIVGGVIALAGLLMVLLGGKGSPAAAQVEKDTRPCPMCAESIKTAAVRCKHCGADVGKSAAPAAPTLRFGWVARVICSDDETRTSVSAAMVDAGFPVVEMLKVGGVAAGAFEKKSDAEAAANHLEKNLGYATTVMFRDKISGDYS
ncbi:hypothetical protein [Pseudomonas sp. VS38]|uniref:hypothetical protein n=1 Tax=Pseudomonas sp. VS38 TaxID=2834066 RepID=UPI001BDE8D36|nr:hypothetical protein [Pseudomonas sp. VS38]MBT1266409.1 hypothetical protein [Pseudomonas sp. VS38]